MNSRTDITDQNLVTGFEICVHVANKNRNYVGLCIGHSYISKYILRVANPIQPIHYRYIGEVNILFMSWRERSESLSQCPPPPPIDWCGGLVGGEQKTRYGFISLENYTSLNFWTMATACVHSVNNDHNYEWENISISISRLDNIIKIPYNSCS